MKKSLRNVGIVIIGRNEGERLKRCLRSVNDITNRIVYVDSGSTDGSIEYSKSLGVDVVELDMSRPFTMARGRNTGFKRMLDVYPDTELVQFIDGDCELVDGYLDAAVNMMRSHTDITVITGRRIERYPDASIYNRLCDMEWGKEIGEINSCGGDMMVRPAPFISAGMFNPGMIAGEEPELCVRLRKAGGKIVRINQDMTIHDAAMFKLSQWWKRTKRCGHAYAEGFDLQGKSLLRHNVRQVKSVLFWGALLPIISILFFIVSFWWPQALFGLAILFSGYFILAVKISRSMINQGFAAFDANLYAFFCAIGKFPELFGIIQYWFNKSRGKQNELIEYKNL